MILLGLIFIGAAVIGGRLKVGGIQIPLITTKRGCLGLFLTGVVAIGLGVHYESPAPIVATGSPSITAPQVRQPIDPSVDYQARVTFSHDKVEGSLDLDFSPPRRVNSNNIKQPRPGEPILGADPNVLLAEWSGQNKPNKQQCIDQLAHHGVAETGPLVAGNIVCVRTAQGRIANLTITSTNSDQIRADATIWGH